MEQWRDIPGYEGWYQVSDQGQVKAVFTYRRWRGERILIAMPNKQGYLHVKLLSKHWFVHRLVMLAFVGPLPEGHEVNHKNGVKSNNCIENLEYVTPKENTRHAVEVLGRKAPHGEESGKAKLTYSIVRQVKFAIKNGVRVMTLSRQFDIPSSTLYNIKYGRTWSDVKADINDNGRNIPDW